MYNNTKPLILLVEDDPMTSRLIEQKMKKGPFNFVHKGDGKEGLQAIMELKPDLVILDIELPSISGYQILQQVRNNLVVANTRVMILTAQKLASVFHRFMKLKVQDFLVKPFDVHELMIRAMGVLQMPKDKHVQQIMDVNSQSG